MKILKHIILALIFFNLPSAAFKFISSGLSSPLSYFTLFLLLIYYFLVKKGKLNFWLILIGIGYYLISAFQYTGDLVYLLTHIIKFFIVVICGQELVKRTNVNEFFVYLLIGSLSVLVHALFFTGDYGRFSGFYINPNIAGFICISGYGLTYGLKDGKLKLIGQFIFTLMGLLTFSRTFIALWLLINLLSVYLNVRNLRIFGLGFLILTTLFYIDEAVVKLENPRFKQLKAIVTNERVNRTQILEDARTETWAGFYRYISEKPFFGNGYGSFQGGGLKIGGAHNTYLLVFGEAGILPFILFSAFFAYLFFQSISIFKRNPNLLLQTIALSVFLLANHNFFNFFYITLTAMWIHHQIEINKRKVPKTVLENA